jgi:hypothetical protein
MTEHVVEIEPSNADGRAMFVARCSCGARSIRFPLPEQAEQWGRDHAAWEAGRRGK